MPDRVATGRMLAAHESEAAVDDMYSLRAWDAARELESVVGRIVPRALIRCAVYQVRR